MVTVVDSAESDVGSTAVAAPASGWVARIAVHLGDEAILTAAYFSLPELKPLLTGRGVRETLSSPLAKPQ